MTGNENQVGKLNNKIADMDRIKINSSRNKYEIEDHTSQQAIAFEQLN